MRDTRARNRSSGRCASTDYMGLMLTTGEQVVRAKLSQTSAFRKCPTCFLTQEGFVSALEAVAFKARSANDLHDLVLRFPTVGEHRSACR